MAESDLNSFLTLATDLQITGLTQLKSVSRAEMDVTSYKQKMKKCKTVGKSESIVEAAIETEDSSFCSNHETKQNKQQTLQPEVEHSPTGKS